MHLASLPLRLFAWALAAVILIVASQYPQRAIGAEMTLLSVIHPKSALQSFEVYHISDISTSRTNWPWSRLIASPDRVEDYLRIDGRRSGARRLIAALAATTVTRNQACRDLREIDVRWAFVLKFEDGTRAVIAFNRFYKCVQVESEPTPIGLDGDFFRFVERDFGFLIDRYNGEPK